jgi:formate hydrogenlyase subunit 3/multisubunit Na+/H+ antiporter MnhD subunit
LQWLHNRRDGIVANPPNAFVCTFGPIHLTVLAVLWASELPEYFGATDGITADGTPLGNLVYATACFVVAAAAVFSVATSDRTPHVGQPHPIVPAGGRQ